ncbi:MAG TPA: tetratricopeptide repeat protein [Gemmatimonadales bacterium]|jgi:tetratricopeptide (TPR) repeat protein
MVQAGADRRSPRFIVGVIALAMMTLLAFSTGLRGRELFDDARTIQSNPSISQLWPITTPLQPPRSSPVAGRPVANLSFAVSYGINRLFGVDQSADPAGPDKTIAYHAVTLLLHLLAGLLLAGIIRRTVASGRFGPRWTARADIAALAIAAMWLVHPLQTDAVDYLTQRTEVVMGLCYLATLYCSIRAWDATVPAARMRWFASGVVASLLGMGSKEVMVTAPLMVALYDRAFRIEAWRELRAPALRARGWFYAALWATVLLLVALMMSAPRGNSAGFHGGITWYQYLYTQAWAIARYLRLVFWPSGLSLDYGASPITGWQGVPGAILVVFLGALTLAAWRRVNRWGWCAFLGSWIFLILAPSSSVVPIATEIAAERRMYLPLAAVLVLAFVGVASLLDWIAADRRRGMPSVPVPLSRATVRTALIGGAALVIVLVVLTMQRSRLYRDPEAIWHNAIANFPANSRAWYNLGLVVDEPPTPRPDDADNDYREAVRLDSTYADALLRVSIDDFARGNYAEARELLQHFPLEHDTGGVLTKLGSALLAHHDSIGALLVYQRLSESPGDVDPVVALGTLYLAGHHAVEATDAFRRAVAIAPARTDLAVFLSGLLLEQHRAAEAAGYLEGVIRRDPQSGIAAALLSLAYAEGGRSDDAVRMAGVASGPRGADERTLFFAGRAMMEIHRPDLAKPYLVRAVALAADDVDAVSGLGEATASLGDRAAAIALFRRALEIDPADSAARAGLARQR